jgi:mycofactocin precursor
LDDRLFGGEEMDSSDKANAVGSTDPDGQQPAVLEEIEVEDLSVDGICGVY